MNIPTKWYSSLTCYGMSLMGATKLARTIALTQNKYWYICIVHHSLWIIAMVEGKKAAIIVYLLTHWPLVTPYGVKEIRQLWLGLGLTAWQHQGIPWNESRNLAFQEVFLIETVWIEIYNEEKKVLYNVSSNAHFGGLFALTHWGRVTHICVGNLTIIGQIMACRLVGTKPSSEPTLEYYQLEP